MADDWDPDIPTSYKVAAIGIVVAILCGGIGVVGVVLWAVVKIVNHVAR